MTGDQNTAAIQALKQVGLGWDRERREEGSYFMNHFMNH